MENIIQDNIYPSYRIEDEQSPPNPSSLFYTANKNQLRKQAPYAL